jgi:hypothetical protein
MLLLDKSTQQAVQWNSDAEHYTDRLLGSLNKNVCRPDDLVCVENLRGPSKE